MPPTHDTCLTVVILTHNQCDTTVRCLRSLFVALTGITSQVIVIDNGSTDNTIGRLSAEFPEIEYIKNSANRGVAPARNQGLRQAHGEYVLILDNDTVVPPEAVRQMLDYMRNHPKCGILGPALVNTDGSLQRSALPYPGLGQKLRNIMGLRRSLRLWPTDADGTQHPVYVIGACQMMRSETLESVGLLDEKIFYGPEDADLCLRVARAGLDICYYPAIAVCHLYRQITRRRLLSRTSLLHLRALLHFWSKHRRLS